MKNDQQQIDIETTLKQLVQIPSFSANPEGCREVIAYIKEAITPFKLFVEGDFEADAPWLLATTQDTKEPDILLAAHLDVVPAEQYNVVKKDGKLYGRGVYDMKFAAACYLQFLRSHADTLHDLNIGILFTTDEENNSASMTTIMDTGLRPKVVFLPDGGDDWMIEQRAKGFHHVRIAAQGVAAHGSRPWEGDNALHTLMDILAQLRATYPSDTQAGTTLAVTRIEGGQAFNQIPHKAWVEIDFRSFDRQAIDDYKQLIDGLREKYNLTVTLINTNYPVIFDNTSPAVQPFLGILQQEIGHISYCDAYGGTDARFFVPYDIPCIILEPHGGNRHADNEWINADDLSRFYQLIERWVLAQK